MEKFTFGQQMLHFLESIVTQLSQFAHALNTCTPETFLRIGTLYPEMSVHEKSVDFYIDLLRKNALDENVPLENLEKSLAYFQHIYPQHLSSERIDFPSYLAGNLKAIGSAVDSLSADVAIGKLLLQEGQENTEVGTTLKTSEAELAELKVTVKAMRRRLPHDGSDAAVSFPASTAAKLGEVSQSLTPLVRSFHVFGRSSAQQAGLQGDAALTAVKLSELLHQAIDKVSN